MRKIISSFLILAFAVCACVCPRAKCATLDEAALVSEACVLMDAYTGEILYAKNADLERGPASTTKIMTLLIAISESDPEKLVTIPACVEDIGINSTRVPVYQGEVMPMRDLWYGLIFKSGNDAANAIAETVSGSVDAFVKEMNAWAKKLGMTHTHYANAHGYTQEGHYTSARDMAILARSALENDLFREITFSKTYTMQATTLRPELEITHNYAITDYTTQYYYKYARGIKTGYTAKAGQCFVGAAVKDGRELIVTILNCGGYKPEKWIDAKALFEYGFSVLESR